MVNIGNNNARQSLGELQGDIASAKLLQTFCQYLKTDGVFYVYAYAPMSVIMPIKVDKVVTRNRDNIVLNMTLQPSFGNKC